MSTLEKRMMEAIYIGSEFNEAGIEIYQDPTSTKIYINAICLAIIHKGYSKNNSFIIGLGQGDEPSRRLLNALLQGTECEIKLEDGKWCPCERGIFISMSTLTRKTFYLKIPITEKIIETYLILPKSYKRLLC